MAIPDTRDHNHNRASQPGNGSKMASTEMMDQIALKGVEDAVPNGNEDDDADISDSEDDSNDDDDDDDSDDDSDSDDSDGSQEQDATNNIIQPHETPVHGGPAVQTSFEEYVHTASQEKKKGKRRAEEDIQPEKKQATLKKRKALGDMSGSNSRTNILAGLFDPPGARVVNAQDKTTSVKPIHPKVRAVSASSALRASKSGNNWPRLQDSAEFESANLADQRMELNSYRKDLFNYVDMIQAGAVPVQFVKSFLRRLDIHLGQMDTTIHNIENLNSQQRLRQAKAYKYCKESLNGQKKIDQAMGEFNQTTSSDA